MTFKLELTMNTPKKDARQNPKQVCGLCCEPMGAEAGPFHVRCADYENYVSQTTPVG